MTTFSAVVAFLGLLLFGLWRCVRPEKLGVGRNTWMFPALIAMAFFAFSLHAISQEGLFGFWKEHTHSQWGNQILFDLVLAASIAWLLMVPKAQSLGMRPLVWWPFVVASGNIAFLLMLARVLYLEARQTHTRP